MYCCIYRYQGWQLRQIRVPACNTRNDQLVMMDNQLSELRTRTVVTAKTGMLTNHPRVFTVYLSTPV